jgi:hypothetical protein
MPVKLPRSSANPRTHRDRHSHEPRHRTKLPGLMGDLVLPENVSLPHLETTLTRCSAECFNFHAGTTLLGLGGAEDVEDKLREGWGRRVPSAESSERLVVEGLWLIAQENP